MTTKTEINEAPRVIYLQDKDDNGKYGGNVAGAEITWCQDQINNNDERYIRVDLVRPLLHLVDRIELVADSDVVCPFCEVVGDWEHLLNGLVTDSRTMLKAFNILAGRHH